MTATQKGLVQARVKIQPEETKENEENDERFGFCSVVTSTYLVLLEFVVVAGLFYYWLYHFMGPESLFLLPIPICIVIYTILAIWLQKHEFMYPIIIAKGTLFLTVFTFMFGSIIQALLMSYHLLRYSLLVTDGSNLSQKVTCLMVSVNSIFWLLVCLGFVTWELCVLIVCKQYFKAKRGNANGEEEAEASPTTNKSLKSKSVAPVAL